MATITFDFTGQCSGGGHSFVDVKIDGVKRHTLTINTAEMIDPPRLSADEADAFVMMLLKFHRRKWLKNNPTGTNAQYIVALESDSWEI